MPTCLLLRTSAFDSLFHHSLLAQSVTSLQSPARKLERKKKCMFLLQGSQRRDSVMTGKDKKVQSSVEEVHFDQDEPLG